MKKELIENGEPCIYNGLNLAGLIASYNDYHYSLNIGYKRMGNLEKITELQNQILKFNFQSANEILAVITIVKSLENKELLTIVYDYFIGYLKSCEKRGITVEKISSKDLNGGRLFVLCRYLTLSFFEETLQIYYKYKGGKEFILNDSYNTVLREKHLNFYTLITEWRGRKGPDIDSKYEKEELFSLLVYPESE